MQKLIYWIFFALAVWFSHKTYYYNSSNLLFLCLSGYLNLCAEEKAKSGEGENMGPEPQLQAQRKYILRRKF